MITQSHQEQKSTHSQNISEDSPWKKINVNKVFFKSDSKTNKNGSMCDLKSMSYFQNIWLDLLTDSLFGRTEEGNFNQ